MKEWYYNVETKDISYEETELMQETDPYDFLASMKKKGCYF